MSHRLLFKFPILSLSAAALLYPAFASAQKPANNPNDSNYLSRYTPFLQKDEEEEKPFINQYDDKYRPLSGAKNPGKQESQSLFSNSSFSINLMRGAGNNPILHISQPVSASGCVDITMPEPEIMLQGSMMWVTIGTPEVTLDKSVRYAHIDCRQAPKAVQANVVLDRDMLIANKVQRITLKNDYGIDSYAVNLGDNKLELIPQSSKLFKPNPQIRGKDPLAFWFYPENTIILSAPQAKPADAIEKDIQALAKSKGLINLSSVVKDFPQDGQAYYFVDPSGITSNSVADGKSIHFGDIKTFETFYGPNGTYEQPKALAVYAKLPGQMD